MTRKKKADRNAVQVPPRAIPVLSDARMEFRYYQGDIRGLLICGCTRFSAYSHTSIALVVSHRTVEITGKALWCRSFGNRVVEIVGEIEQITFAREKNG